MQNSELIEFSSRVRFQRCHSEEHSDEESVFVSFSRFPPFRLAGRSLPPAEARKHPAGTGRAPQLRPNPRQTYFVILNEVKNLFPCEPKAACGLCLARRRKTNEVQSNICIVSIQILRRSAPQNDKLLNCSQTPQQTGMYSWRQRSVEKHGLLFGRLAKVRIANLRRSAGRAEAPLRGRLSKLAPPASARDIMAAWRTRTFIKNGLGCGSRNSSDH